MDTPVSSGIAARLLGTTEPRLNGLIRHGKISPLPDLIAGRRAWGALHIAQAAKLLGASIPGELLTRAVDEGFEMESGSIRTYPSGEPIHGPS